MGSNARLKTLIRNELKQDQKTFGDKRQSKLVHRAEAQALKQEDIIPAEAITAVLSKKGWVRAAKGHEVEGEKLNYRAGDELLMQATGKSNQSTYFLDSQGKAYSLPAHTLPSARGQGEPLTSRLKPGEGSHFVAVLMGDDEERYLIASDAGYGFITPLKNLLCKSKGGKAFLKLPKGAEILLPQKIEQVDTQFLAVITNEGRLLLFSVADLPELPRGKGNKMISISSARASTREEFCVGTGILNENSTLTLYSGKRHLTLKPRDLANFHGERGRRGNKLPRGFRQVNRIVVNAE